MNSDSSSEVKLMNLLTILFEKCLLRERGVQVDHRFDVLHVAEQLRVRQVFELGHFEDVFDLAAALHFDRARRGVVVQVELGLDDRPLVAQRVGVLRKEVLQLAVHLGRPACPVGLQLALVVVGRGPLPLLLDGPLDRLAVARRDVLRQVAHAEPVIRFDDHDVAGLARRQGWRLRRRRVFSALGPRAVGGLHPLHDHSLASDVCLKLWYLPARPRTGRTPPRTLRPAAAVSPATAGARFRASCL